MIHKTEDFVSLVIDKAQHLKQTQYTIAMDLRNSTEPKLSMQQINLQSKNWTESCGEVHNNIIINPIQIW